MEVNKAYQINITDISGEGYGFGKIDGMAVFVDGALPGEIILAKITKVAKSYACGDVVQIKKAVGQSFCPYASYEGVGCGGCQFSRLDYTDQLRYKKNMVNNALHRIGGLSGVFVEDIISCGTVHYRNKTRFQTKTVNGHAELGFFGKQSHDVTPVLSCPVSHESVADIINAANEYFANNKVSGDAVKSLTVRSGVSGIMVCVESLKPLEGVADAFSDIRSIASVCLHNPITGKIEIAYGAGYIEDVLCGLRFRISPLSFYQINNAAAHILYEKAIRLADISENDTVIDAYCGIGTITLTAAKMAKYAIGIELYANAIADARHNAEMNNITNVKFITGAVEKTVDRQLYENPGATLILDPPRKGCERSVIDAATRYAKRVVYVSCNPHTLARDMKVLVQAGFAVEAVEPVDMFPHTSHIECVVLMSKK